MNTKLPDLLTYQRAAIELKVSERTLYRMCDDEVIFPVMVPRPSGRGTVARFTADEVRRVQAATK